MSTAKTRSTKRKGPEVIGLRDLPRHWKVEVGPAWRGLEMKPTFSAQLWQRYSSSKHWYKIGKPVLADRGPLGAVSDLLLALEKGVLPR